MNLQQPIAPGESTVKRDRVSLPQGILGFEHLKHCLLIAHPEEEPFLRLQAQEDPSTTFLVVEPFRVVQDYRPDISEQDARFLGLQGPDDAQLYNIVTVGGPRGATVNLKGPVVFNRHTGVGKQVIPNNAVDYSVQHPLPLGD